jgi:hypothetical protein
MKGHKTLVEEANYTGNVRHVVRKPKEALHSSNLHATLEYTYLK